MVELVAAITGGVIGGLILACCIAVCVRVIQLRWRRRIALALSTGLDADERRFKRRLEAQMAESNDIFEEEDEDGDDDDSVGGRRVDAELSANDVAQLQMLEEELAAAHRDPSRTAVVAMAPAATIAAESSSAGSAASAASADGATAPRLESDTASSSSAGDAAAAPSSRVSSLG